MKRKTPMNTLEDLLLILLMVLLLALWLRELRTYRKLSSNEPTIEDLHQQQKMIDWHRAQGYEIGIVNK